MNTITIDNDLTMRPLTMEDAPHALAIKAAELVELDGSSNLSLEDIITEWTDPGFDPQRNTRGVFTPDGKIVGYVELWDTGAVPVNPYMFGYTLPEYRGRGIGTALLRWAESLAAQVVDRVPEDAQISIRTGILRGDAPTITLLEDHDFSVFRATYEMIIDLESEPPAPQFPPNLRIVSYAEHPDVRTFAIAHVESFRDHFGYVDQPLEARLKDWQHIVENDPTFDPNFWWVALDGDQPAGLSVCDKESEDNPDKGWVNILGVLRPYRKQGLGLALLQHTFGAFYRLGKPRVGLGVDASSLTGATRLYERAGMRVNKVYDMYRKVLRDGRDLSTQTLAPETTAAEQ